MQPNDPTQPQQSTSSSEADYDWGQVYASQPNSALDQPSSLASQSSAELTPMQSAPSQPMTPQPPDTLSRGNFNAAPLPMQPRKLPGNQGPFVLLFNEWIKHHWRLILVIIISVLIVGVTIFQIVYPNTRLLPGASIDGAKVGGMRKDEAAALLDKLYGDVKMSIYFGKNNAAFVESKIKDIGINVVNADRVAQMDYPLYLKFIPGSIFWANNSIKPGELSYVYDKEKIQAYTAGKVGDSCTIPAKDAMLKLVDSQLQIIPSLPGGECDITEFQRALAEAKPTSTQGAKENKLRIDSTETPAAIDDEKARSLADRLNKRLKDAMPITLGSNSESVPGRIVMSWLDFKADIPEQSIDNANQEAKLIFTVNNDRITKYLSDGIAAQVVKKPGVSKVSTLDFKETARTDGAGGTELDMPKIITSVADYIDGKTNQAVAATRAVGPTVIYTRNYTPTSVGYNALLAQFAQDNPGTYGLAITELVGAAPRSGAYNADARFSSAGIESLYLGYSVLMEKGSGALLPGEVISAGRKVDVCLKDMYVKFDEGCRLGFYTRFGHARVTARGAELGLKNTVFANNNGVTSANDLHKVLIGLYKNQIARAEGGQQILTTARTIRSNDGIPAGAPVGEVAHFVGENTTVRNDAAIVYSSKGVYALSVVSDGSSWEKIAELTKKIQAFKEVKVPKGAQ